MALPGRAGRAIRVKRSWADSWPAQDEAGPL